MPLLYLAQLAVSSIIILYPDNNQTFLFQNWRIGVPNEVSTLNSIVLSPVICSLSPYTIDLSENLGQSSSRMSHILDLTDCFLVMSFFFVCVWYYFNLFSRGNYF